MILDTPPNPGLELREMRKSFGAVKALRGVSFDLRPGEIHALVGENGAGKSTLIKIAAGAHEPDSGTIRIGSKEFANLTPRTSRELGIAVIYQQPALFPELSIAENMALFLDTRGPFRRIPWRERRKNAESWLREAGADLDPDLEAGRLSMPEQQRVEIARALAAGAQWLILDEPTASLNERDAHHLLDVLTDLKKRGTGCIYISHRLEEISAIADRVTVLRDGQSVGTFEARALDSRQIIRLMVGRDATPQQKSSTSACGDVCLRVRSLSANATGLRNISFDLHRGEILGLAGLVGSGRTELARILFGLDRATSGEIRIEGRHPAPSHPAQAVERGIAYVPEDRRRHGVIPEMSVSANVTLAAHRRIFPRGWLNSEREKSETLEWIGRLDIRTSGPSAGVSTLSGGNQQKVALARWLATSPTILIVDEPTQGVDVGAKAEIHRLLQSWAAEGLSILLISSDLTEILHLSDRVGVMCQGTLACILSRASATPESVMSAALGNS